MKVKIKIIVVITILIAVIFCSTITEREKDNISGSWMREDNAVIEFFSEGAWEGEEVFEGIGGEWRLHKDKIIMKDLLGNTFEATLNKDEKGEHIVLNGEAYHRCESAK